MRIARVLGVLIALLVLTGELSFRSRDADAALQGTVDAQIIVALAISLLSGGWLLTRRLAGKMPRDPRRRSAFILRPGSPFQVFRLIGAAAVVSSYWSPTTIAPVRALQLVVVIEVAVEVVATVDGNPPALAAALSALEKTLVTGLCAAAAITFLVPGFSPWFHIYGGPDRFRLLAMHPVATANLMGLTALLLTSRARRLRGLSASRGILSWSGVALLLVGVVATGERSSGLATFIALVLMLVSGGSAARRRQFLLLVVATAGLLGAALLPTLLLRLVTRGQTTDQLATFSGRNLIFTEAWRLFTLKPVAGWGYNAGRSVFLPTIPWAGESHNVLVEIAVSFGVLGLILYGALFFRWWRRLRAAQWSRPAARELASESLALVAFIMVIGVGADSFAGPPRVAVLALGLALALGEIQLAREKLPVVSCPKPTHWDAVLLTPR